MESKWEKVRLGDICTIRRGSSPRPIVDFITDQGMPWVKIADATESDSKIIKSTKQFLKEEGICKSVIVEKGDLILSNSGTAGLPKFMGITACIHDGWQVFRDLNGITSQFLYYSLLHIRANLLHGAYDSTMKNLTLDMVRDSEIQLPSIAEQNAITHVLCTLDEKMELSRNINQTLDSIGEVLFKSWFVDFDPVIDNALAAGVQVKGFPTSLQIRAQIRERVRNSEDYQPLPDEILNLFPSEFVESELGWVPKGWQVSNIGETCSHIIDHRGKTPKKLGGDWADEGFSAISAKNIKRNQIVRPDTIRYVDKELYQQWMKVPLQPKDILMTSEAPMGEMFFLADKADYLLSQRLYGMRADEEKTTGEFLNYWLQTATARADLEGRATGTTVTGIRQVELKKVAVLLPELAISNKFSELIGQYLLQKEYNNAQITSLEETRDYLLPNLISGKVQLGKVS